MKPWIFLGGILSLVVQPLAAEDTFAVTAGEGSVSSDRASYQAAELGKRYPLKYWAKTSDRPLRVLLSPENLFQLLPRSEVQITGAGSEGARFRRVLKLNKGSINLELDNLQGGTLEVETPTAICGAVGTRFSVSAESGDILISEGKISARSKSDSSFIGQSISGSLTLAPGTQNAYTRANVTGSCVINGVSAKSANIILAKAAGGTSSAAVQVLGGTVAGKGAGRYLMEGSTLTPVDASKTQIHTDYLAASKTEGSLNLQKQALRASGAAVPATLNTQLNSAAARATELRNKLFVRGVVRDAARDNVRQLTRPTAPRPRPKF